MTDWERRVEEAGDKYVFAYSNNYAHDHHPTFHYSEGFTAGANWAREELENKKGAMPLELVDRSRQLLKSAHQREIDALRQQCEAMAKELESSNKILRYVQEEYARGQGIYLISVNIENNQRALAQYKKFKEGG